jgi:hypothetical protein
LNKYRRIEVNAFRRRVTIVSGEWPVDFSSAKPSPTGDDVSLNDTNLCEPVEPDSPDGQLLLVEAVRSLERHLSPEARAKICAGENILNHDPNRNDSYLHSICDFFSQVLRFTRKEK